MSVIPIILSSELNYSTSDKCFSKYYRIFIMQISNSSMYGIILKSFQLST